MSKLQGNIEYIIDTIAVLIVIEWFLRLVHVPTFEYGKIHVFDFVFILVLAIDLLFRYRQSNDKKHFVNEHWIEFISLIPMIPLLRIFRIMRIIRKSRLKNFFQLVKDMLKTNSLIYVILIVILLTIFGGGLLFRVEARSDIPTLFDGIWLAFVTMTTVGYGDYVPLTNVGRFIAMVLMITGMGFLGVLTGSIASFFTTRNRQKRASSETPVSLDTSGLSRNDLHQVQDYINFLRSK